MALKIFLPPTLDTTPIFGPQPPMTTQPPQLVAFTRFAKIYVLPGMPDDEIRIQAGGKTITCKVSRS
ncbi:MAG: hypothetical protein F9K46_14675 [Anaerolineae bacterium]|nr:MAG: hypothetical protein F9K46_14675 [Anaerolineae bacterium]